MNRALNSCLRLLGPTGLAFAVRENVAAGCARSRCAVLDEGSLGGQAAYLSSLQHAPSLRSWTASPRTLDKQFKSQAVRLHLFLSGAGTQTFERVQSWQGSTTVLASASLGAIHSTVSDQQPVARA